MQGPALRVLTAVLVLAAVPHDALAQAGRVGGAGVAAPVVAPAPAPVPVVPAVPSPAVPMVHPVAPPAVHATSPAAAGSIAVPQPHVPSIGAVTIPHATPHIGTPLGSSGIHTGLTARTSPTPHAPALNSRVLGVTATPPAVGGRHVRHHRRQGIDTGLLWGDPGTCWVWVQRPGHRRLRLHRC